MSSQDQPIQEEARNADRCDGCPFGKNPLVRPKITRSRVCIVGESPGIVEIRTGVPFTGPSGKLLWGTLEKFGMSRDECAVTNALCCAAPNVQNKVTKLKPAVQACSSRLFEDIALADPDLIIALGNTALHSLTHQFSTKITHERGMIRPIYHKGLAREIPVLPTFHPAAILRTPGEFKKLHADLEYAVRFLNGEGVRSPGDTRWKFIQTDEEAQKAIALLGRQKVLAADIESTGLNSRDCPIIVFGISWDKNKTLIFPERYVPLLKGILEDPTITWVWHNGKFDTSFFQEQYGIKARTDEDTMLLSYVMDETRGSHGLKDMSSNFLGAPDYEKEVKKYAGKGKHGWGKIPLKVLNPYLARDADYTFQLYSMLRPRLRTDQELNDLYDQLILPLSRFLQRVEQTGIYVNQDYIITLTEKLIDRKDEILTAIAAVIEEHNLWDPDDYQAKTGAATIPFELNPSSPQQVKWLLYNKLGLRAPKGYDSNTAEGTLQALRSTLLPPTARGIIDLLLDLRKVSKQLGTYCEGILREIEGDGRVHCTFLVHGTATGRLSSRNPNLQNIPRNADIKAIFQAPPGRYLVENDLKAAELRMLAHLSADPALLEIFHEGRDLHDEVAIELYGPDFTEDQRVRAKAVNFGIPYGRTEYSLMSEFNISFGEANELIDKWFSRFPEVQRYLEEEVRKPWNGKSLRSPFGRRRRYPLLTDAAKNEIENECRNFAIQSGASDLNLLGAMLAEPLLLERNAFIVNLVHDSIVVECDGTEEEARACARIIHESVAIAARTRLNSLLDFPMDSKFGTAWGYLKKLNV